MSESMSTPLSRGMDIDGVNAADWRCRKEDEVPPQEDREEKAAFMDAVSAFANFGTSARAEFTSVYRNMMYSLPSDQVELLRKEVGIFRTLDEVDFAIEKNAILAERIAQASFESFGFFETTADGQEELKKVVGENWGDGSPKDGGASLRERLRSIPPPSPEAVQKVRSLMHQFYREWSAGGATEREACYSPVVEMVNQFYSTTKNRGDLRILIPGAGLGRLVYDFAREGYQAVGNEISYEALLASSFILNNFGGIGEFEIFPFALQFKNVGSRQSQLLKARVPDVDPSSLTPGTPSPAEAEGEDELMKMEAGDFIEIYSAPASKDRFDALTSVFFIDTCPNPLAYLATASNCIKPGGLWVNLGPLLWHTNDNSSQNAGTSGPTEFSGGGDSEKEDQRRMQRVSVPLSDDEIVKLLPTFGFRVLKHIPAMPETGYGTHPASMLSHKYRPSFWAAVREDREV